MDSVSQVQILDDAAFQFTQITFDKRYESITFSSAIVRPTGFFSLVRATGLEE